MLVSGAMGDAHANHRNVENKLKVAFLLNFAKFTSWPPKVFAAQGPFLLCVDKADPFDGALQVLANKQVAGRQIQLRYSTRNANTIAPCHLLFFSVSESKKMEQRLCAVQNRPVLTVSDIPGFAQAGGIIELRRQGKRMGFVVNNQAAKSVGLHLSASLLQLALEVL